MNLCRTGLSGNRSQIPFFGDTSAGLGLWSADNKRQLGLANKFIFSRAGFFTLEDAQCQELVVSFIGYPPTGVLGNGDSFSLSHHRAKDSASDK